MESAASRAGRILPRRGAAARRQAQPHALPSAQLSMVAAVALEVTAAVAEPKKADEARSTQPHASPRYSAHNM